MQYHSVCKRFYTNENIKNYFEHDNIDYLDIDYFDDDTAFLKGKEEEKERKENEEEKSDEMLKHRA